MAWIRAVFMGRHGIRTGWRLLLFLVIFGVCLVGLQTVALLIPGLRDAILKLIHGNFNPAGLLATEIVNIIAALIALGSMAKIESRTLKDYGLPLRPFPFKHFCQGVLWGLAYAGALYTLVWAEGCFSFGKLVLTGTQVFRYGLFWAVGTLAVGLFEESVFRGYAQATLSAAWGFWRSAVLISIVFGLFHLVRTPGFTWAGVGSAAAAGILYSLCVLRTGSIWMAIGLHASSDFVETFVFTPSEGGISTSGHLLSSALRGPVWLTGGSAGPEASINGLLAFVLFFTLISSVHRKTSFD